MKKLALLCFAILLTTTGCLIQKSKEKTPDEMQKILEKQGYDFMISYIQKDSNRIYTIRSLQTNLPSLEYKSSDDTESFYVKDVQAKATYKFDSLTQSAYLETDECKMDWENEKETTVNNICPADAISLLKEDKAVYQSYFNSLEYQQSDFINYMQWFLSKNSSIAVRDYLSLEELLDDLGYQEISKGVYLHEDNVTFGEIEAKNLVLDTIQQTLSFESTSIIGIQGQKVSIQYMNRIISIGDITFDLTSYKWLSDDPGLKIEQECINLYSYFRNYLTYSKIRDYMLIPA